MAKAQAHVEETALAPTGSAELELSQARPAFLTKSNRGIEEQTQSDIILPRLALCQSQSPQKRSTKPNYIPGLQDGQIFNTVTGTVYGDKVTIIPIYFYKMRMMFKPIEEGGGLICASRDVNHCNINDGGPCQHSAWGANGEKPACMEIANFFAFLPGTNEQIVWSCKTTQLKAARQLNSLLRLGGVDAFARAFEVRSLAAIGPNNTDYFTYAIKPIGYVSEDRHKQMTAMYDEIVPLLRAGRVQMDVSDLGAEEEGDASFDTSEM